MIPQSQLLKALLDLHHELQAAGVRLVLGGGYGLYLRQLQLQEHSPPLRTILPGELWPIPRSTEDIDLFLGADIVANVVQMRAIRTALDHLGYKVVEEAKFFQFSKAIGEIGRVKIDFLTGPIPDAATGKKIRRNLPRVRPGERVELHAYLTEEALDLFEAPTAVDIVGTLSNGIAYSATIFVPSPFTFLLMKLHALADRLQDANKDLGRHHALDVYRIVALMTEAEYQHALVQSAKHRDNAASIRAATIVQDLFATDTSLGVLRLREHPLFKSGFDFRTVSQVLMEIFPGLL